MSGMSGPRCQHTTLLICLATWIAILAWDRDRFQRIFARPPGVRHLALFHDFVLPQILARRVVDIPAFIALILMVLPWLPSKTSLVSWVLLTTTRSCIRSPGRPQSARRITPENHPIRGSFNCRCTSGPGTSFPYPPQDGLPPRNRPSATPAGTLPIDTSGKILRESLPHARKQS